MPSSWLGAKRAVERRAQKTSASLGRQHPRAHLPWRLMPDVLVVTAFKFGDPVPFGVGVKSDDSAQRPLIWLRIHRVMQTDEFLYRLFAGGLLWATAAFTSALNALASTFSPSWMSIALRVLPSKLELKRREGSGILAPRANVSFTTFVYASPVQTIPWCDQTGVPIHFHSSVISGSASRISARMRARVDRKSTR